MFGATVEQDVGFGPLNNGLTSSEARVLVAETLESLGISHLAGRPIHELSLGEKKRVALAGVLVLRPRIILLDEPTAGLDFAGISAMLGLLNELHRAGTTLVISTHDTDLAYGWAKEAWVLVDGCVAAQGPIGEVLSDRLTLRRAHLKIPWLIEVGLAIGDAFFRTRRATAPCDAGGIDPTHPAAPPGFSGVVYSTVQYQRECLVWKQCPHRLVAGRRHQHFCRTRKLIIRFCWQNAPRCDRTHYLRGSKPSASTGEREGPTW